MRFGATVVNHVRGAGEVELPRAIPEDCVKGQRDFLLGGQQISLSADT